ncbi:MAG: SGNH/GDSL hydrolase family protein [Acidobacteriota bacterium]|nr:SGNH/GDSL hydrolase family protein [Blastocatellia bacterium]MDW8412157.1 SGNH/GDSL hydrolase family protein [Acidobacteriota bacterium]
MYRSVQDRWAVVVLALLLLGGLMVPFSGSAVRADDEVEPQQTRRIDFSVIAVMGDSLSQCFQDGVIRESAQNLSYIAHLAKQVKTELRQALVRDPGFGNLFKLKNPAIPVRPLSLQSFLNLDTPTPVGSPRVDPSVRVNNFAVGGAKVNDLINARPDPNNPATPIFVSLGIPWLFDNPPVRRSQIEFVETMNPKPTAIILFIGGNDALAAGLNSNLDLLTDPNKFATDYEELVRRAKATGAQLILVTVPDIPLIPAFVSNRDVAVIAGTAPELLALATGIQEGDYVTLRALPSLVAILNNQQKGPLPKELILTKKQAKKISKAIKKYNAKITEIAAREKFPVVDLNVLLNELAKKGIQIPGVGTVNNKYFGGVGSLDGIHLTNTGNALLANAFIDTINKFYNTSIPLVDVVAIAKNDPLMPKGVPSVPEPMRKLSEREVREAMARLQAAADALISMFPNHK